MLTCKIHRKGNIGFNSFFRNLKMLSITKTMYKLHYKFDFNRFLRLLDYLRVYASTREYFFAVNFKSDRNYCRFLQQGCTCMYLVEVSTTTYKLDRDLGFGYDLTFTI